LSENQIQDTNLLPCSVVTHANMIFQILSLRHSALTYATCRVNACDREERYEALKEEFASNVNILGRSKVAASAE
jgi:hypothetical protein